MRWKKSMENTSEKQEASSARYRDIAIAQRRRAELDLQNRSQAVNFCELEERTLQRAKIAICSGRK
jgi:hypothetical protein